MRRIEVVATLRDAYAFAFAHLGGIIGLIWVPMVLTTVAQFFTFHRYYNSFIDAAVAANPALLGASLLTMLGYLVAAMLLYAVMVVAVVQLTLGARADGAIVHFSFGPLEWRTFRAFMGLVGIGLGLTFIALTLIEATSLPPLAGGGALLLIMATAFLLLGPRLILLLPAVAVAETAPVLRRAWALSQGNHLRLLAVLLGVVVPPFLVALVAEMLLGGQGPAMSAGLSMADQVTFAKHALQMLPLTCGLSFFISPLVVGLFAGASVAAWRGLKDEAQVSIVA